MLGWGSSLFVLMVWIWEAAFCRVAVSDCSLGGFVSLCL
jgi:hypothetical protein